MKLWPKCILAVTLCAGLSCGLPAFGDEEDKAAPAQMSSEPSLNREQQNAVGIVVAHPIAAQSPQRLDVLGVVLDPTTLLTEQGDMTATAVAEQSASAELSRVRELYKGAGASLKMLEAAQAAQAKALAESQSATARFALHWGPVADMPAGMRQKLLQGAISGRNLLLRADLPGRHSAGKLPSEALLDVDGIQVPGRILGALRQTTDLQSVGLLVQVPDAPVGLGPGARIPLALLTGAIAGFSLPRDAILYDENGAYVYKQLTELAGEHKARYSAVKVTLLAPYGDGWLVAGVGDDDDIVVHGVGVLWSLRGVAAHAVDED